VIDVWLAALIVGVVVALIGYLMVQRGINGLKSTSLMPEKTLESIKEDKQWVQDQVK
jgi:hypothetical protein